MFWLAWKTLYHEKGRFFVTVVGIVFSTILVLTEVGIYLGMMRSATDIIRHNDADIWIASKNIQSFDFANTFPESRKNRVESLADVLWAEPLVLTWGFLKLANGGQEQVQIVGFNPDKGIGAPWSMIAGRASDVKGGRYMILDKTSEKRLGSLKPDSLWELSQSRFRLVGVSQDIRSFTTAPVLFMSYAQAQDLPIGWVKPGVTSYILAKLKDRTKKDDVVGSLRTLLRDNDVMTSEEFVMRTVRYWTIQTGIGMSFFLTALLGLMIGGAIVGQTIYANTVQHMKEYGTLKAMGAKNEEIYKTIFSQALISAVAGYALGTAVMLMSRHSIEAAGVPLYLSPLLIAGVFIIISASCLSSAYFSVRKIKTLDPVMVFRG
ncbi:MAG: ABC transporter permease [Nitrospirae bacterium]|nr:ABC transporter permease [Nitrospirota bacterium]